jgi:cell division protein FtsL
MRFKRAGFLTKIVVLSLLIYMATSLLDLRGQIQVVQGEVDAMATAVSDLRVENQEKREAIENSDDPEVRKQVALEKGYVPKNAQLFIDVAN